MDVQNMGWESVLGLISDEIVQEVDPTPKKIKYTLWVKTRQSHTDECIKMNPANQHIN